MIIAGLFAAASSAIAAEPDGTTIRNSGGAELCRPQGSCFIPEPNDPIFVGDEITTYMPGRIEFSVNGHGRIIAAVVLGPNGVARIDRGNEAPVVDLVRGLLIVAVRGTDGLKVTFAGQHCTVTRGSIAIGHDEVDGAPGATFVANRDGECVCMAGRGATAAVAEGTIVHLAGGEFVESTTLTDTFWANIREQR